jgi:hypothetical protein
MQIVVSAMDTLVDGHQYNTYVLMSGDRDFTPLVQSLRKRGKYVIGVGIRRTSSGSLVELCDEYIFYEDLVPAGDLSEAELEQLIIAARDELLKGNGRARASVFMERMTVLSEGRFGRNSYPRGSFTAFLGRYPHLVQIVQEDSTTFVAAPGPQEGQAPLFMRYRASLKKQRLRVIPAQQRFAILRALIEVLNARTNLIWHEVTSEIDLRLRERPDLEMSKSMINAALLVARQADIISTLKGKSLSSAPVLLELSDERAFQEAVISVDNTYLKAILELPEPFDFAQAALALYDSEEYVPYLRRIART